MLVCVCGRSNSQLTKGYWLAGGTGQVSSQTTNLRNSGISGVKDFDIKLMPNVGYFFVDKLAGGARFSLDYEKQKRSAFTSRTTQLGVGPFLRYYFLNADNQVNVFADGTYQYSYFKANNGGGSANGNKFTFSAGPVFFFNTSVGLELAANYQLYNNPSTQSDANTFYISIGF